MADVKWNDLELELVVGDITRQADLDAVVNAANRELAPGGGVAGAIHRAAGPGLDEECKRLAPIAPGAAVITEAYRLPNRHVIHCLGPVYGRDLPSDELLAGAYRHALELADSAGLRSIGFPALSTGVFGYPMREAALVAFRTVRENSGGFEHLKKVRFVLFDDSALQVHREALAAFA